MVTIKDVACNSSGHSIASNNCSVGTGVVVVALAVDAVIRTSVVVMLTMVVLVGGNGCSGISVVVVVVVAVTVEVVRSLGASSNCNNVHSRSVGGNGGEGKC